MGHRDAVSVGRRWTDADLGGDTPCRNRSPRQLRHVTPLWLVADERDRRPPWVVNWPGGEVSRRSMLKVPRRRWRRTQSWRPLRPQRGRGRCSWRGELQGLRGTLRCSRLKQVDRWSASCSSRPGFVPTRRPRNQCRRLAPPGRPPQRRPGGRRDQNETSRHSRTDSSWTAVPSSDMARPRSASQSGATGTPASSSRSRSFPTADR